MQFTPGIPPPKLLNDVVPSSRKGTYFSFWSSVAPKPETFEDLQVCTELHSEVDRILWKLRPYTNLLEAYRIPWSIIMPPNTGKRTFDNWTFVNIQLSTADEQKFVSWYKTHETHLLDELHAITSDGYKLSLSYDFDNVCYIATLSGTKNSSHNTGCSISGRSAEMLEALGLVLFKHLILAEGKRWLDYTRPSNWG